MAKNGVIALDDFTDPYNQVRAAYYHNRYANEYPFELLIIGFGKGILVHQDMFNTYEAFVINELQEKMSGIGLNTTLFRTDYSNHSRAFSIATKKNASDPDLYGVNIWGKKFYKVSK